MAATPGGTIDPSLIEFLKQQAPGAKYILTVCSGSWVLADTGLLNGKKATTNKAFYNRIVVKPG
jgi:putative intracellular protease/amidase